MPAYVIDAVGTNSSTIIGGNLTPGLPAGLVAGELMLMRTGAFSTSLGSPVIAGWTKLSPNTNAPCSSVYGAIALGGGSDVAPVFQWNASAPAYASIVSFTGDVYTDLSTIVLTSSDRGTNATGAVAVNNMLLPGVDNALILRGGHCVKSAANNGSSFLDWVSNPGIFSKIGTDVVQNNANLASTWWYWQQTNALTLSTDLSRLTNTDTSANSQGWTIALRTLSGPAPVGDDYFPDTVQRRSRQAAVQTFWQVPIEILTAPAPVKPPGAAEMPNPIKRKFPFASHVYTLNQITLGTDKVLLPATWDYEWDKPSLPVALRAESQGLGPLEFFILNNIPPYIETNWPVPKGPRQFNRGYEFPLALDLYGKDTVLTAGIQNNMWDPPRAPRRSVENLSWNQSGLSLFYFVPPQPVGESLTDRPPYRARRNPQDFISGIPDTILRQLSTMPPFQASQSLPPIRRPQPNLGMTFSLLPDLPQQNVLPVGEQLFDVLRRPRRTLRTSIEQTSAFLRSGNNPFPPITGPGKSMGRVILPIVINGSLTVLDQFDFLSGLSPGEVLSSCNADIRLYSGIDANPSAVVTGISISGSRVLVQVHPLILGNVYSLAVLASTSLGGNLLLESYLVVAPGVP